MSVTRMKKLTVYAYESDADQLVRSLMRRRCVEIGRIGMSESDAVDEGGVPFAIPDYSEAAETAERKVAEIDRALSVLAPYSKRKKGLFGSRIPADLEAFEASSRAQEAYAAVGATLQAKKEYDELIAEGQRKQELLASLEPWSHCRIPLGFEGTLKTAALFGSFPSTLDRAELTVALGEATGAVEFVGENKTTVYAVVIYTKNTADDVAAVLAERGFLKADFKGMTGRATECLRTASAEIAENAKATDAKVAELARLAQKIDDIEILHDAEATTLNAVNEKMKLLQDGSCVILSAWMPYAAEKSIGAMLDKMVCAYETADPAEGEEPPVLLQNNSFSQTFEWVIGMYAYPKYGRFDPTVIMSIFYFFMFGLMFADVGYGLILVLACFGGALLLKPRQSMKRFLLMFGYCGISSIVMGMVFGGWFGNLPLALMENLFGISNPAGVLPFFNGMWFNPLDDPMTFLVLSLGVGAVHLIAGMACKFYVICRDGKPLDAILDIVPWWILFAGFGCFIVDAEIGKWVTIAGVASLILTQGRAQKNPIMKLVKGVSSLYGLISYVSDLLSYSRILALGLVAGVIAQVINLITMMGKGGVVGFIVMVIVLILGHLLNLAINVLGTFVHTSRLQYIEFFGKFFEDGGRPFKPAAPDDTYTEEIQTK